MALYAIGDLHLSLGCDKPMDVFGGGWVNYTEKLRESFSILTPDDVCVLCGDLSWGMSLNESINDFMFIDKIPGKKIILKGNHDYWWTTAAKMKYFFNKHGISAIEILHNNCYNYEKIAICGTRGWMKDDSLTKAQNEKIMQREVMRLRLSLEAADKDLEKICFFHFPPLTKSFKADGLISQMKENDVTRCFYGHLHGHGHALSASGIIDGIMYENISADYVDFKPVMIV